MDADERERINNTNRAGLQGVHAVLADALDDWLVKQHGVMSSAHAVGSFLADLAEAGLQVVPARVDLSPNARAELDALARVEGPQRAEAILTAHQRMNAGSCLCGWAELGRSHAGHQAAMLREAGVISTPAPGLSLSPAELLAALGSETPPPDIAMGSMTTWVTADGKIGIESTGGPLLAISLELFRQRTDPELITTRDGVVVFAGVDRAGDPIELHYRAIGLQTANPAYLGANEGGYLLLELMP